MEIAKYTCTQPDADGCRCTKHSCCRAFQRPMSCLAPYPTKSRRSARQFLHRSHGPSLEASRVRFNATLPRPVWLAKAMPRPSAKARFAEVEPGRSALMSRIRSSGTKPEIAVRRALHALGFRFRLHRRDLPGKPDIVLPKYGLAIFVHGCFWHQHAGCRPLAQRRGAIIGAQSLRQMSRAMNVTLQSLERLAGGWRQCGNAIRVMPSASNRSL
jgi:DNA mismatch endonuclease Vsr